MSTLRQQSCSKKGWKRFLAKEKMCLIGFAFLSLVALAGTVVGSIYLEYHSELALENVNRQALSLKQRRALFKKQADIRFRLRSIAIKKHWRYFHKKGVFGILVSQEQLWEVLGFLESVERYSLGYDVNVRTDKEKGAYYEVYVWYP